MPTTTGSRDTVPQATKNPLQGKQNPPRSRLRGAGRPRSVPHLVLGVLLVVACATGFVVITVSSGHRHQVLTLANAVTIGHILTPQDLREATIPLDAGLSVVEASQASTVVGRPMGTSLPAGALLTAAAVGTAPVPGAGQGIAALALKPGQFPPGLTPGIRVSVVFVPAATGGSATAPPSSGAEESGHWPAVVTDVTSPANEQVSVVSVALSEAAARQVAAVPAGQLAVVLVGGEH